ncbi:MAG: hypothetical protein GVY02_00640 [Bacteroidetes bacterium]|nr:hypothetical protein [Bacteroidota bacterium]
MITGQAVPEDQLSYRLEPFQVPEGTGAIEVQYEYSGQYRYAEIEIGLFDPNGFRGTSRFSKSSFLISKYRTTPSYFPGPVPAGRWQISLGFPTVRATSEYEVRIRLIPENHPEYFGPSAKLIRDEEGWYQGDFHTHTGHSDAFGCHDTNGNRSPCQAYQVAEAAQKNGLDFVSINDHNTTSHHQDMLVIQPTFPDLLLLRGQEVTTFYGHANVMGTSMPVDFRVGFEDRNFHHIQQQSDSLGSLFVIAHPGRETGPNCTGCGWSADSTNYDLLEVVEIVNGTNVENEIAGIPFWHELLNKGYRITGIGGSDDHAGGFGSAQPGTPTTVVWADGLSEKSLIDGVKSGRVYLKTKRATDPDISFYAERNNERFEIGHVIKIENPSSPITFSLITDPQDNLIAEWIMNGETVGNMEMPEDLENGQVRYNYVLEKPEPGWLRLNLRRNGEITTITNPIYLN